MGTTMLKSPVIESYFTRDRAALLSFLAILSGSHHEALVDAARQMLILEPELARENDAALLREVARQGSISIVELLLQLGADPNACDQLGHTPLYRVGNAEDVEYGAEVVRALVRGGAQVNARECQRHCTALHMAARRGNVAIAEALLDCGADCEARDNGGDTPLHRAVKCGKAEMAAFLISRGADVHAKDKSGQTPVQCARGTRMQLLLHSVRA